MSVTSDSSSKVDSDEMSERPFVCPSLGCTQKFTTPDQLAVHKQKHQMTLTLGSSKLNSLTDVLPVDQTPTPTRFLHLGNQIGLFDELNPFDKEFKTAQKEGLSSKQKGAAALVQQLQVLNNKNKSPSTQAVSSDVGSFSMAGPLHVIALTPTLSSPVGLPGNTGQFLVPPLLPSPQGLISAFPGYTATSPMQVPANLLSPTLMPFPTGYIPGMSPLMADAQRAAAFTHAMFAAAASASSPLGNSSSVASVTLNQDLNGSVSTSQPTSLYASNNHTTPLRSNTLQVPSVRITKQEHSLSVPPVTLQASSHISHLSRTNAALPQIIPTVLSEKALQNSNSNCDAYSASLQQPSDQTTCNTLPASNVTTSPQTLIVLSSSDVLPTTSSTTISKSLMDEQQMLDNHSVLSHNSFSDYESSSIVLDAKQKLKETLTTNNPQLQQLVTNQHHEIGTGSTMHCESDHNKPGAVRKRGRQSQELDPDIKRQRFLERNRAAASRCRSKKKVWVNGLESKAKGLSQTNIILQNEIASLKDEIASLKQLLLSHRDCPITKRQQQNMAFAGINLDLTSTLPTPVVKSEPVTSVEEDVHSALSSTLSENSVDIIATTSNSSQRPLQTIEDSVHTMEPSYESLSSTSVSS